MGGCLVERRPLGDLEVIQVSNQRLELCFIPDVGGRLISLRFDGTELLWRNPHYFDDDLAPVRARSEWPCLDGTMASWANVGGSKTWPAPQGWSGPGEWAGPPDEVLDAGRFQAEVSLDRTGAARVIMTSPYDPATGLCIYRRFVLEADSSKFTETARFVNLSRESITWSIWEVAQVDTSQPGGRIVVDVTSDSAPVVLLTLDSSISSRFRRGQVHVPTQAAIGKLGFTDATGRIAYVRPDGIELELVVELQAGIYPDGGCPVELWMQHPVPEPLPDLGGLRPDADLIELEVLSPLVTLAPNEQTEMTITWGCDR